MKHNQLLGELEKKIMKIVWVSKQPVTVRMVFDAISSKRNIAYTTVMTIMGRLVAKGYLKKQTLGKAYLYKTTCSQNRFLKEISRQTINNFVAIFGESAIAYFTEELEKIPVAQRKNLTKVLKNSKDVN